MIVVGRQGIPMESEERIKIIDMYIEGMLLNEIVEKTGFSDTAIIRTIEVMRENKLMLKDIIKV